MSTTSPPPPKTTSLMHQALHQTALSFIASLAYTAPPPHLNIPLLRSLLTQTYTHTFGHNYFVSRTPPLQGPHDLDSFVQHLGRMSAGLAFWRCDVRDVCVDEARRVVVVRVGYYMEVKGAGEAVENDLVWWLWMDGEGTKVERSVEYVDAAASNEIRRLMVGAEAGSQDVQPN